MAAIPFRGFPDRGRLEFKALVVPKVKLVRWFEAQGEDLPAFLTDKSQTSGSGAIVPVVERDWRGQTWSNATHASGTYAPTWTSPDGRSGFDLPDDVRSCMRSRMKPSLGYRAAELPWHRCAATLQAKQAPDGFGRRYWSLIAAVVWTLLPLFVFALAMRSARAPHRVLRGRRVLTDDDAATRAFVNSAPSEIKQKQPSSSLFLLVAIAPHPHADPPTAFDLAFSEFFY